MEAAPPPPSPQVSRRGHRSKLQLQHADRFSTWKLHDPIGADLHDLPPSSMRSPHLFSLDKKKRIYPSSYGSSSSNFEFAKENDSDDNRDLFFFINFIKVKGFSRDFLIRRSIQRNLRDPKILTFRRNSTRRDEIRKEKY